MSAVSVTMFQRVDGVAARIVLNHYDVDRETAVIKAGWKTTEIEAVNRRRTLFIGLRCGNGGELGELIQPVSERRSSRLNTAIPWRVTGINTACHLTRTSKTTLRRACEEYNKTLK